MHETQLILTLTASLGAALVLGFITYRLGLSPIVGYLLAGLIVGPYTPGFVADRGLANQFAEIGVVLLMFGVGLHFHPKDLLAVRNVAILGALTQSSVATILGTIAGRWFGWSWSGSIVFGVALSVASTVVLLRVLVENQDLHTPTGRIAIGWLIVEDIFTVVVLVLLPAIFLTGNTGGAAVLALLLALLKLAAFAAFTLVGGKRLIPWVLNAIAVTHSRELFTLTILVLALGIGIGSAMLFGASMALGAFLAGTIVGQSEFSLRAASEALPMRDAFAVLFFVSVGMVFDPAQLMQSPLLLLFTLLIVIVGKPLAAFAIVALLGYGSRIALGVSVALAQIGEFSLILATLGAQLNILPDEATNAIVAGSIVTIALNGILYRFTAPIEAWMVRHAGIWRIFNGRTRSADDNLDQIHIAATHRAIVVGFGPIGQTVARLLREGGILPVVAETNLDLVRRARSEGYLTVYGDATHPEVLADAGIKNAVALIISGPPPEEMSEIIRVARQANPDVRVLARSYYLRDTFAMREAGANEVFSGEGEVALAMTEYILNLLGSPPELMDRERQRVREELFRNPV